MRNDDAIEAQLQKLEHFHNEVKREKARRRLIDFTLWTKPDYEVNWHHRLLSETLDRVRVGEIQRLLVFMPPQHGKSELISRRWPAHILGTDPNTRIIATSYSKELATFNGRAVKKILHSEPFTQLFGRSLIFDRSTSGRAREADLATFFEMPKADGYYLGAGIMGGMTGFGYDIGIVDDPIKNQEEANSEAYRKRLVDAYETVFLTRGSGTRKNEGGERIVCVFTRWRYDDLAGHILEKAAKAADPWHVLTLPAVLDQPTLRLPGAILVEGDPRKLNEALWPERYPLRVLAKRKANSSIAAWEALYQQRPSDEKSSIFPLKWWRYYEEPPRTFDFQFQSWDCAFKETGTSRVCGITFGVRGADLYVLDLIVEHMSFTETKDAIMRMCRIWPNAYQKVVENKANGPAIVNELRSKIGGFVEWEPEGSKISRWNAATPPVRAGNVHLPRNAPWLDEFTTELRRVPLAAYDDQADAFSQGVLYWREGADAFPGW